MPVSADFEAHRYPVMAVPCPDCEAPAGRDCRRPSGHRAADFHAARKRRADAVFVARHGEDAWIERLAPGLRWRVHANGRNSLSPPGGVDMQALEGERMIALQKWC